MTHEDVSLTEVMYRIGNSNAIVLHQGVQKGIWQNAYAVYAGDKKGLEVHPAERKSIVRPR